MPGEEDVSTFPSFDDASGIKRGERGFFCLPSSLGRLHFQHAWNFAFQKRRRRKQLACTNMEKKLKVQYRVCGTEPTKRFARHVYTGEGNMGLFCGFLSTLRAGNDSSFCHGWRSLLPFPASASALASLLP